MLGGSSQEGIAVTTMGGVLRYRTLQADLPSLAIARAPGFQRFALTSAVRLTPPVRVLARVMAGVAVPGRP
jgi:hypothetical protein